MLLASSLHCFREGSPLAIFTSFFGGAGFLATTFLGATFLGVALLALDTVALLLEGVALLAVGAFFLGAAFLGADLLALDAVALLLDALGALLLLLGVLFLAPEPLLLLLFFLLLLALLLLDPAPFDLCLLRDLRPLLAITLLY